MIGCRFGLSKDEIFEEAIRLHRLFKGKIEVVPKVPIRSMKDFSIWYTPGVAGPARKIADDLDEVFELTSRWNTVAVISDGTRVLGLGDIGPYAAYPVMEGKALLFKYLGGVDAVPIVLATKDLEELIRVIKVLEPSFGGINLEDIESPKCFFLLERLRKIMDIPVWHDDQQGTALVVLAALINAFKLVDKDLKSSKIVLVGLGAANYSVLRYLEAYGVNTGNIVVVERPDIGILYRDHPLLERFKETHPHWYEVALKTNSENITGGIREALKDADAVIAASRPGPGIIKPEWIKEMNDYPIVFALANPVPEILPEEALKAGAKIVATGRSDYPNQVNNSLGFPAVFRGALQVRAKKITDEMCIAAAKALAKYVEETGLSENRILPKMTEVEAYVREAIAVAEMAINQGIARRKISRKIVEEEIREIIERAHKLPEMLGLR